MKQYDVIILGGGPAGITSAIYAKRAGLSTLLLDTYAIGGNINNYTEIENIPGFGLTDTQSVAQSFIDHLRELEIEYTEFVGEVLLDHTNQKITCDGKEFTYDNLIIATGSKPKQLNVPMTENCQDHIHYCAICDGPLYKDKCVAVIGGGNSACEEALGLAKICKQVHIIEYTNKLNADQVTQVKIRTTDNIRVYTSAKLANVEKYDINNTYSLELRLVNPDNTLFDTIDVDGIFVYIGMIPNIPTSLQDKLKLASNGFILVNDNMQTSIPNIYAVGDVIDKKYRQVVTAMADGAIAAIYIAKNS